MRWNVAIAATGRCKRVCTGSAARSVERVALPWTCFGNREPKAEIKPLGRYTRHVGDTHDTESLLQCLKEDKKPGKFLLPHGMILLSCGLCIFMEDNP